MDKLISIGTFHFNDSGMNRTLKKYIINCLVIIYCLLFANFKLLAQVNLGHALPEGYFFKNISEPRGPTVYSYNDTTETYYIDHQGGDDTGWGTFDNCCMVYFETSEDKEIVARMVSLVPYGSCTFNPKGFIMVRSSLEPEAAMAYLELRTDGNIILDWRPTTGFNNGTGGYSQYYSLANATTNTWIKFIREGAYVSGFFSKDGIQWTPVGGPVKLKFTGKVYMGIGAAGCCGGARVTFDKFAVRDKVLPYSVNDTIKVLRNVSLNVGQKTTSDITKLFGHYLGDYFTIDASSTDPSVAKVKTYLVPNPDYATQGGDKYFQKLDLTGVKDGITDIKLYSNVLGFKMSYDFLVDVKGTSTPYNIVPKDPAPWILMDLGMAANPSPSQVEFGNAISDGVKIYGNQATGSGADTVTSLFKWLNRTDNMRLIGRIDSVANSGKGSFAGLMMRDTSINGSPYVSFTAGAYEGLRFSYRWANNVKITNIDDKSIELPVWLMLDYTKDFQNNTLFQPYYSYDSIYWNSFLKYPLPLNFTDNTIMAGLAVSGGSKTSTLRKSFASISNFDVKVNTTGKIHLITALDSLKSPLTLSPNPVSVSATISYSVVKPGNVYLAVYDVYGVLKEVLYSGFKDIGPYTVDYNPAQLKKQGIYLLKYISKGDYQTLKFIFQ